MQSSTTTAGARAVVDQQSTSSRSRSASPTTSDELRTSSDSGHRPLSKAVPDTLERTSGRQTGPKGVRADAQHHAQRQRRQRADEVSATNARMEALALGKARTWKEDEEERKREADIARPAGQQRQASDDEEGDADEEGELEQIRQRRLQTIKSQAAANESRRKRLAGEDTQSNPVRSAFGHLREVGADHFGQAIDCEGPSTYIVVHIYVKYVHNCAVLTSALSSLARMHTNTKFIQIRAGSIGFGSGGGQELEIDDEEELDDAAQDVVPTLLVYRAGKVVANLVRIDLDEGWGDGSERNIRNILETHNALR